MKDLVPVGWTFTPNPVTWSSHAIQGRAWGIRASILRLVKVTLTLAMRLPRVLGMFLRTGVGDGRDRRASQQNQRRRQADARREGGVGTGVSPGIGTKRDFSCRTNQAVKQ